ncbi:9916_t:CDS:2 [Cetraspora pellucida]|uniref:9916_t:CDS:1 n=1 Tax=Cetraspora pellucida TaxID=1433469 RepID=A0ACA9L3C5_9GLOM|nr:9916_t:CDS:2 [Cetraspora pellucida]
MYTVKESDITKYPEFSPCDEKMPAVPVTNVKNNRDPTVLLLGETGVKKNTHGNWLVGFEENIEQKVSYQKAADNCFKPSTKVILNVGEIVPMSSIKVGDKVCVGSKHGVLEFSEVYLIVHCDPEAETEYQKIEFTMPTTGLTESILLTPDHHIFINNYFDYAKNVQPYSAQLHVLSGARMIPVRVANVSTETHKGYISILTRAGTIVADNILCSCYASCVPYQDAIHTVLSPLRFMTSFKKSTHTGKGTHPYLEFLYNRYKDVNRVYNSFENAKSRMLNF